LGFAGSAGNSGAITSQSSSVSKGFAIRRLYPTVPRFC
jgi:hypothetical protein